MRGEHHVTTEVEIGVMRVQAKEHQELLTTTRSWEAWNGFSLPASRRSQTF